MRKFNCPNCNYVTRHPDLELVGNVGNVGKDVLITCLYCGYVMRFKESYKGKRPWGEPKPSLRR